MKTSTLKLTSKPHQLRMRALRWDGPPTIGPSRFLHIATSWLKPGSIGPIHPEDGSIILAVDGRTRRVGVGDYLVRFDAETFAVLPASIVGKLFDVE